VRGVGEMRRCVWGMRRCVWDEEKQVTQEAIKREEGRYKSKVIASFCGVGFIFQLSLALLASCQSARNDAIADCHVLGLHY
jgi:hypothetical protein